jgi:hypothetical protein
MMAGSIPLHSGNVDKSVLLSVQGTLGTDNVHLLTCVDAKSGLVYYFAAPSKAFASLPEFSTALAAVLPSHPDHKGEGIYVLKLPNITVAVEMKVGELRLLSNDHDIMEEWLRAEAGKAIHDVSAFLAYKMESITGAYRRLADGLSNKLSKYSAWSIAAGLTVYFAASVSLSYVNARADKSSQAHLLSLNEAVSQIDFVSPLSTQMAQLQKVSAVVVRAGGWIDEYDVKDGKEQFVLSMPAWVTKDYIEALGPGITSDRVDENLIQIRKAANKKSGKGV